MAEATAPAAATTPAPAAEGTTPTPAAPAVTSPATAPAATAAAPAAQPGTTTLTASPEEQSAKPDAKGTVPESYEFKGPDGVQLDTVAVEKFSPLFKEAGLTQESAQKLVDGYANYQKELVVKQSESWLAEAKADKEIGGEGFDVSAKAAQQAFAKFGDPSLKQFLETTGLGNHPALLKMFVRIAKASSEDTHVPLNTPSGQSMQTMAKRMFPDMN